MGERERGRCMGQGRGNGGTGNGKGKGGKVHGSKGQDSQTQSITYLRDPQKTIGTSKSELGATF